MKQDNCIVYTPKFNFMEEYYFSPEKEKNTLQFMEKKVCFISRGKRMKILQLKN